VLSGSRTPDIAPVELELRIIVALLLGVEVENELICPEMRV